MTWQEKSRKTGKTMIKLGCAIMLLPVLVIFIMLIFAAL